MIYVKHTEKLNHISNVRHMIHNDVHTWVRSLKAAGLSPETIDLRQRHVHRALAQIGQPLDDLSERDLIDWFATQKWKPATRRSYRASLQLFFKWRANAGLGANLADNLPSVAVPRAIPRPASDQIILEAIRTAPPRVQLMMELMAYGGLRRGETSRVHSRNLNGEWLEVTGKGGHTRLVPLPPHLCNQIRDARGWLFPGDIDGHLSAPYVGKLVSRHLPTGITAHMLRHRFATVTYRRSKDIRAVQTLLGHAKLDTTMIYVGLDDDARRAAAGGAWSLDSAA